MKRLLSTVMLILFASTVSAGEWVYGPTAGLIEVAKGDDGNYHANMFTLGGFEWGKEIIETDGDIAILTLTNPHVLKMDTSNDEFVYATGLMLQFFRGFLPANGGFGLGAVYDMANTGSQTGAMLGKSSWQENGRLLFGVGFSLGSAQK